MDATQPVYISVFILRGNAISGPCPFAVPLNSPASRLVITIPRELRGEKVRARDITMWKPNSFLALGDRPKLNSWMREHRNDLNEFCTNLMTCEEEVWIRDLSVRHGDQGAERTCLIAQIVAEDRLTQMDQTFAKNVSYTASDGPSVNCRPSRYRECQENPRMRILDGRFAEGQNPIPPPVEIFHPAFAAFVAESQDPELEIPESFVQQIHELRSVSKIGTRDESRDSSIGELFGKLLGVPIVRLTFQDRMASDHGALYTLAGGDLTGVAALAIIGEKTELGSDNDAVVQASFSYREHWAQRGQKRLTNYLWIAQSRHLDDAHALRTARVFWALGRALHRLEQYYATLPRPDNTHSCFLPLATRFTEEDRPIDFEYVGVLGPDPPEASAAFRARERGGARRDLVVKSAERYGEAAHRLLAAAGLAPALLYGGDVWQAAPEKRGCGSVKMVVMEYVEGKSAEEVFGKEKLPAGVVAEMRRAIGTLHSHAPPLVHGDMRKPNVLIVDGDGDGDADDYAGRVKIVDFDWAGVQGEVRYPLSLSTNIRWPEGVSDYALIEADHDKEMVESLAS